MTGGLLEQMAARLERIEKHLAKTTGAGAAAAGADGFIDQKHSPLGPRRHCAAARRLAKAGDTRAYINGRRHCLTQEAIHEEMARLSLRRSEPANDAGEPSTAYERAMAKALAVRGS
jgi:hypothetical protein